MKKLLELNQVIEKIKNGERLILAGCESLLNQLPQGNWIAGTIPYFMDVDGGVFENNKIFVDQVPVEVKKISIKSYDENTLKNFSQDKFDNGYSTIIIPANSKCHQVFAQDSHSFEGVFNTPLIGWIAGINLSDLGKAEPKVYDGSAQSVYKDKAVIMHLELPENKHANIDIINLFQQGDGETITFDSTGFSASDCFINGEKQSFSKFLTENKIDTKLPLVANYCGAIVNTSFQSVDSENNVVNFYAPVFKGVEYKIAKPVEDYIKEFTSIASSLDIEPAFTCNCILNYLYSELEGKKTGKLTGPITFGEIAYQLLNQTLVYLTIEDV